MKKFFQHIFLALACLSLACQTGTAQLLNEGFNVSSFPPTGWQRFKGANNLGNTFQWSYATGGANGSAGHANAFLETITPIASNTIEKWLVTPQLQPSTANNILNFKARRSGVAPLFGKLSIRVSTTSQTAHASFTQLTELTESTLTTTYADYSQNLSAYNGQNIYVAFVWVGNGDNGVYLDDVKDIPLTPAAAPIIAVKGNNNTITSGSTSTDLNNHTNFGIAYQNASAIERTYTIQNTGTSNLNLTGTTMVALSGAGASAYTVTQMPTSPVAPVGSTTFKISLSTTSIGVKLATVTIANNANTNFTFAIAGTIDPPPAPMIALKGNNTAINNGATTTSATNDTNFGNIILNGTAIEKTYTITNDGELDLNLTGTQMVAIAGADASMFSVSMMPTSPVALNGGTTTFKISFNPNALGTKNATISIANNTTTMNPFTFAVSATVPSAQIDILGNGVSLENNDNTISLSNHTSFGNVKLTLFAERTFTIKNTGGANLELSGAPFATFVAPSSAMFTITQQPTSPIVPNGTTTFKVKFAPTGSTGFNGAYVRITSNSNTNATFTILIGGTAIDPPVPFIQVLGLNGNNVAQVPNPTSALSGTDFGTVQTTFDLERTFNINNAGDATLTLTGAPLLSLSGADASEFSITQEPATNSIAPGQNVPFKIRFAPTSRGVKNANVTIVPNNATGNTFVFHIKGNAIGSAMAVKGNNVTIASGSTNTSQADSTNFGAWKLGDVITRTYTIQSTGELPLNLTGNPIVTLTGADASFFTISQQPANATVAVGNSTTFKVRYTANQSMMKTAVVSIANNANTTYTFAIRAGELALSAERVLSVGKLQVYPNPTKGILSLHLENNTQKSVYVAMYDLQGKKHFSEEINLTDGKAQIRLQNLQKGFYLLKVMVGKEWVMEKLMVE